MAGGIELLAEGNGDTGGFPCPGWCLQQHGGAGFEGCLDLAQQPVNRQGLQGGWRLQGAALAHVAHPVDRVVGLAG